MANNRMYLKCSCGGLFGLGKRMGDGYYMHAETRAALGEALGEFYDKHEWCAGGLDHFEIAYESPPNYDHGPGYEVEKPAPNYSFDPDVVHEDLRALVERPVPNVAEGFRALAAAGTYRCPHDGPTTSTTGETVFRCGLCGEVMAEIV
jgi:hypothetical protein